MTQLPDRSLLMQHRHPQLLSFVFALAACGGSEPPAPPPARPLPAEQVAALAEVVPAIPSLPPPVPAETPVNTTLPAAPAAAPMIAPLRLGGAKPQTSTKPITPLPTVRWRVAVRALESPTDLAFAPGGVMFYTERERGLWLVQADRPPVNVFTPRTEGSTQIGHLLSVAVDPDFARSRAVFLLVANRSAAGWTGKVIRLQLDAKLSKPVGQQDVLVNLDWGASSVAADSADAAQLGTSLRFGPDGHLYVGLGDGLSPTAPQFASSLSGKVLRVSRDGKAASGNLAPPGFDARVFAYGFRQPVGLVFHPNTEQLVVAEQGGVWPDELTIAKPGANGGWDPRCRDGSREVYCTGAAAAGMKGAMTDLARHPSAALPAWQSMAGSEGLVSTALLRGEAWKDWNNSFVLAYTRAKRIDLVKLDHLGQVARQGVLLSQSQFGFQAVAQGSDGLYVATHGKPGGDEIWQLLLR